LSFQVFNNAWPPLLHVFSKTDDIMAATIDTYWTNMVYFLNPNGNATESRSGTLRNEELWNGYDADTKMDMILAVPSQMEKDYFGAACNMWDGQLPC
jgi:hypothetical protein